jgi:DNA-binding transcriptional regulator YiaG
MMNAYSELYLNDAMNNLGEMIEFAVCNLEYDPDVFFGWFISSGIAGMFEKGNPKYIAGMSGCELAEAVLRATNVSPKDVQTEFRSDRGRVFWAGWILAYYQWQSAKRFEDIVKGGLSLSTVLSLYVLHEADMSKFVETADEIISRKKLLQKTKLREIRKARGFTQQQLSDGSGASLRMIQLYEQKQNDIGKAQVSVILKLAGVLGCDVEDLI